MVDQVDFQDFVKLEIKIGTVVEAEKVEGADRLIRTMIDFGNEKRQVVAGFGHLHKPEELLGKQVPVVINIKETEIRGVKSQGIFVAIGDSRATLLVPEAPTENGSKIK